MNRKGFTLVELIVVIAILAILAALLLPSLTGMTADAQATVCKNNMEQVRRYYITHGLLDESLVIEDVLNNVGHQYFSKDMKCPSGGNYVAFSYREVGAEPRPFISCTVHSIGADKLYAVSRVMQMQYKDLLQQYNAAKAGKDTAEQERLLQEMSKLLDGAGFSSNNPSYVPNDYYMSALIKQYGNPVVGEDGSVTYEWNELDPKIAALSGVDDPLYLRPYLENNGNGEVILYASTDKKLKGGQPWAARMVFNHENGKWYEYKGNKSGFNMASMTFPDKSGYVSWDDLKQQFSDTELWEEVA